MRGNFSMEPRQRSFVDLFADISRHGKSLVKAELELLSSELAANGAGLASAGAMAAVAGAIAFSAFNFFLVGAVFLLMDYGFHGYAAAFIVAGCCLFVSIVLGLIVRSRLSSVSLVPHRTIAQIQLDAAMLERSLRNG